MCHLHVMSYKNIYKDQKCSENTGDTSLLHPEDFIERCMFLQKIALSPYSISFHLQWRLSISNRTPSYN